MESGKLKAYDLRALEWYAAMEIEAEISCIQKSNVLGSKQNNELAMQNTKSTNPNLHSKINEPNIRGSSLINDLPSLQQAILDFEGCLLKQTATNTVFGDGVPTSKIMLIGEAPGATEDAQGIPFCGESGKLLDNMIASIGLFRTKNVYITNTIFWRPPGNRPPTDEEIEACRPFVEQHIALINPELLILVGSTAVTSLLGKHLQISKIRQEYYQYTNKYLNKHIATTALFHPAYLLRQPMQKKTTWYDLLKIKSFIEQKGLTL